MSSFAHVSCALCGAGQSRPLYRPEHSPGPVVRCRQCGLVYISPREDTHALIADGPVMSDLPRAALESRDPSLLEGCWELPSIQQRNAEWPALNQNAAAALDIINRYTCPPGKLLDYGCGAGFFLRAASERGWECYGLEPLVGHAVWARSWSGADVVADTIRENTYQAGFFDVVTAFQVFEHLPDPSVVLERLRRILRQDGLLLVEVPNVDTWSVRLLGKHHRHFVEDHLYFFSSSTLCGLMIKHGFEPLLIYRPKRHMTLGYFLARWGVRVLTPSVARHLISVLRERGLEKRTFALSVGDIIAVVSQRR